MPDHTDFLKLTSRDPLSLDALYAAHGERGFANPAWEGAVSRVLIVRLSPFRDVERSTPHEFLFREARAAMPGAYLDFSFFPTLRDRSVLGRAGVPWMHGVASRRGAVDFDVVLVSNSYTLELVNLAPFLAASGLPPSRSERDRSASDGSARYPLIVLGGSNAMASAAAYDDASGDSLVDAVYFGEGEGSVGRLVAGLASASREGADGRLAGLASLTREVVGFWPTAIRLTVAQAKARPDAYPVGAPPVIAGEEAGTSRLEITRGCPSFCSFCFEGWERKPFRERPLGDVIAEALRLKAGTGADTVELASYNFNAHSDVVAVIRELHKAFWAVSFQSQRVDILARSPGLVRYEVAAGKRSFTVGVEGVSARARAYFSKELAEADLRAVLERIVREGAREIKLFYILSGFEDAGDMAEFSAFVGWLRALLGALPSPPRVMFSAGELIRMPFTPLAYESLILDEAPFAVVRARFDAAVAGAGFESRAPERFDEYCLSQVLALAPPGSYGLLLAMAARGYVYDRALSRGAWEFARAWLDERGILSGAFMGEKPRDYPFPYPFLTPVASREHVYRRFLDVKESRERTTCLGGDCAGCGACSDADVSGVSERAFLAAHRLDEASERDLRELEAVVAAKRKPYEAWVGAALSREAACAPPAYAAASFRKALYAAVPALVDTVWTAEDAFLKSKAGLERLPGAWGDTVYRVLSSAPIATSVLEAAGYVVLESAPVPERLFLELRLPGASIAEAVRLVADFLNASAIPHTLRKEASGSAFVVSDKGRKKGNVLEARVALGDDGAVVGLVCGRKYDVSMLIAAVAKRRLAFDLRAALADDGRAAG
ncbi:MAG: hypothetical protein CVV47_11455 [Spirochaetae bacterium HGW-Spirochaetae-3]|nr:MAG: hypothetical protein CVV47_11455 [Spirochaetae bacterium HGW-Spirochaetae-3]